MATNTETFKTGKNRYTLILKTETLTLSQGNDGFWLYDKTRSMNLSMRAKTKDDAFIIAIEYYQKRLTEIEESYYDLKATVDGFVEQFKDEE